MICSECKIDKGPIINNICRTCNDKINFPRKPNPDIPKEWTLFTILHVDKNQENKNHCDLCNEYLTWCEKRDNKNKNKKQHFHYGEISSECKACEEELQEKLQEEPKKPKQYYEYFYSWREAQEAIDKHEKNKERTCGRPLKNDDLDENPKEYRIWYERIREEDAFKPLPSNPEGYDK